MCRWELRLLMDIFFLVFLNKARRDKGRSGLTYRTNLIKQYRVDRNGPMSAAFVREYHRYAIGCLETPVDHVREVGRILWRQQQCASSRRRLFMEMFRAPIKELPEGNATGDDVLFPIVNTNTFFSCLLSGCTVLSAMELRRNCFALLTGTTTTNRLWILRDLACSFATHACKKKETRDRRVRGRRSHGNLHRGLLCPLLFYGFPSGDQPGT